MDAASGLEGQARNPEYARFLKRVSRNTFKIMTEPVFWWSLAGIAVLTELLSGTFYLLMIAIGFTAGALVAHMGFSQNAQFLSVSLVSAGATYAWHRFRVRHPGLRASRDKSVELDIGETVDVPVWDSNFTARVKYRGTVWTAELEPTCIQRSEVFSGLHHIVEVRGNNLIVRPREAKHSPKHPWS